MGISAPVGIPSTPLLPQARLHRTSVQPPPVGVTVPVGVPSARPSELPPPSVGVSRQPLPSEGIVITAGVSSTIPTPPSHHLVGRNIPVGVPSTTIIIITTPLQPPSHIRHSTPTYSNPSFNVQSTNRSPKQLTRPSPRPSLIPVAKDTDW